MMEQARATPFAREATAAVSTALVLVPQALGYAVLAGLPPVTGLRAAGIPLFAYAAFGSSPAVAVGPVAVDALLTASALTAVGAVGLERVGLAACLALMVGLVHLAMGALGLGRLTELVSLPVLVGFTLAAAVLIALTQAPPLLGFASGASSALPRSLAYLVAHLPDARFDAASIGGASVLGMIALDAFFPRVPRAPLVLVVGTLLARWVPPLHGAPLLGDVPLALPVLSLAGTPEKILALVPHALTIAVVAFVESYAVAKRFAATCSAEPAPARELYGLGAANVVSGLVGGMPITGGLSRSAVQVRAGARDRKTGALVGLLVLALALLLAPVLELVPRAAIAGVVIVSAFGLVDREALVRLRKVKPADLTFTVVTALATLTLGFTWGIAVGVGASIAGYVRSTTRPHVAVLGRIPGTTAYRNVKRYPQAEEIPGVLLVRIDAELYFGNATFLRETIDRLLAERPDVRAVVLEASGVNQLDASAEAELASIVERLARRKIPFALSSVKGPVRDVLRASGLSSRLGDARLFLDIHSAATAIAQETGGTT